MNPDGDLLFGRDRNGGLILYHISKIMMFWSKIWFMIYKLWDYTRRMTIKHNRQKENEKQGQKH